MKENRLQGSVPMKLDALRSVPLFRALNEGSARELFELLSGHEVAAGGSICRRGDVGDSMFLIERGEVRISVTDADGYDTTLAELKTGDFFGEMSLLDNQPRAADATATVHSRLGVLPR